MEFVANRNGYLIYREIVNGKGVWYAKHQEGGELFSITYRQARGFEPIDEAEALGMYLGKLLLPQ